MRWTASPAPSPGRWSGSAIGTTRARSRRGPPEGRGRECAPSHRPRRQVEILMRSIEIVDLSTGIIERRKGDTPTLDIPQDLDPATGGVSVDASSLVYYFAAGGRRLVFAAMPILLSSRPPGTECLVAD